jgi:uncharacterized protein YecE (DUF72 family)
MPSDVPPSLPSAALLTREERRVRRQERRDKQRALNPARAAKMHAARLATPLVANPADSLARRFNIGCSGWFYWPWRGRFYPEALPTNQWFPHYTSKFSTVELNAPFYSWPTVAAVQSWLRQIGNKKFVYTVKVCELITHIKRFSRTALLVEDFYHIGDLLGPHMGCFLFQLPPSFHYSAPRLKRILDQLDPRRRNVIEFRHASWWNSQTYKAFKKTNTIFCSLSAPRLPDQLIQTHDEIYIRLHGLTRWYRHNYTRPELQVWTDRIRAAAPSKVWAYFDNDNEAHAPRNARTFLRQLSTARIPKA